MEKRINLEFKKNREKEMTLKQSEKNKLRKSWSLDCNIENKNLIIIGESKIIPPAY